MLDGSSLLEWLNSIGVDVRGIGAAAVGAIVGAVLKWLLDRREKAQLRRATALVGEKLDTTLGRLADQETANAEKQRELDRLGALLRGKGEDITRREDRLTELLNTLRDDERGLWAKFERQIPFPDYDGRIARRKPIIITIANLKGGVGKTTVTGNLAAVFDKLGMRVLIIDLDYQGSLTTMLRRYGDARPRASHVNELFRAGAEIGTLLHATRSLGEQLPRSRLASAFYEFARLEDYLMIEWLLQQGGDDVRYRLAHLLLQDSVSDEFDVILIDTPPRLTTGTVNALCASKHVLVTTIFNPLAAEPVSNFLAMATGLMTELNPSLRFLGVLETMVPPKGQGVDARSEGERMVKEALLSYPDVRILGSRIPRQTAIANVGLAALEAPHATKRVFQELGREVREMVGLAQSAVGQPIRRGVSRTNGHAHPTAP
jgi:cellulose biosynthesis protein BcsQ